MKKNRKRFCSKFGFKMNNIVYAAFLAMLLDKSLYGYLLVDGLNEYGINSDFVQYGAAYRILRNMEIEGLVTSEWETAGSGPARRVYHITESGRNYLKNWVKDAYNNLMNIEKLIDRINKKLSEENAGGGL